MESSLDNPLLKLQVKKNVDDVDQKVMDFNRYTFKVFDVLGQVVDLKKTMTLRRRRKW